MSRNTALVTRSIPLSIYFNWEELNYLFFVISNIQIFYMLPKIKYTVINKKMIFQINTVVFAHNIYIIKLYNGFLYNYYG